MATWRSYREDPRGLLLAFCEVQGPLGQVPNWVESQVRGHSWSSSGLSCGALMRTNTIVHLHCSSGFHHRLMRQSLNNLGKLVAFEDALNKHLWHLQTADYGSKSCKGAWLLGWFKSGCLSPGAGACAQQCTGLPGAGAHFRRPGGARGGARGARRPGAHAQQDAGHRSAWRLNSRSAVRRTARSSARRWRSWRSRRSRRSRSCSAARWA